MCNRKHGWQVRKGCSSAGPVRSLHDNLNMNCRYGKSYSLIRTTVCRLTARCPGEYGDVPRWSGRVGDGHGDVDHHHAVHLDHATSPAAIVSATRKSSDRVSEQKPYRSDDCLISLLHSPSRRLTRAPPPPRYKSRAKTQLRSPAGSSPRWRCLTGPAVPSCETLRFRLGGLR